MAEMNQQIYRLLRVYADINVIFQIEKDFGKPMKIELINEKIVFDMKIALHKRDFDILTITDITFLDLIYAEN
ncbi:Uncharacterized protein ACO02O_06487 [Dirofilaria immitis]